MGQLFLVKSANYFFTLTSFLMEQHDYNCLVCSKGETGKSRHKCIFLVEYLYLCWYRLRKKGRPILDNFKQKKSEQKDHVDLFIPHYSYLIPAHTGSTIITMSVLYIMTIIQQTWLVQHKPSGGGIVIRKCPPHVGVQRNYRLQQMTLIDFWQNSIPFLIKNWQF